MYMSSESMCTYVCQMRVCVHVCIKCVHHMYVCMSMYVCTCVSHMHVCTFVCQVHCVCCMYVCHVCVCVSGAYLLGALSREKSEVEIF